MLLTECEKQKLNLFFSKVGFSSRLVNFFQAAADSVGEWDVGRCTVLKVCLNTPRLSLEEVG